MTGRFAGVPTDASEHIALEIRRYVEAGALVPGDRIGTEQELADEFGVSRPTLREALRLLAGSHLIRVGRGRAGGIFVARTPVEGMARNVSESMATLLATGTVSVREMLEACMFLEVPLAEWAAARAGVETDAALARAIGDARPHDPGSEPFGDADVRFHRVLAETAGNDLVLAISGWTLDVCQRTVAERMAGAAEGAKILAQHRAIAAAVRRRRPSAAGRAMRAHLQYLLEILDTVEPRRV